MAAAIDVNVIVRGPLFTKKIDRVVKDALVAEVLTKVDERAKRQGKRLGALRNTITTHLDGLMLTISSTMDYPRTRGTSYVRHQTRAIRAMARRVMQKAAERIVGELS